MIPEMPLSPNTFVFTFSLIFPLCFGFYLPDSNPLLVFSNQVREVHLYTGTVQTNKSFAADGYTSKGVCNIFFF